MQRNIFFFLTVQGNNDWYSHLVMCLRGGVCLVTREASQKSFEMLNRGVTNFCTHSIGAVRKYRSQNLPNFQNPPAVIQVISLILQVYENGVYKAPVSTSTGGQTLVPSNYEIVFGRELTDSPGNCATVSIDEFHVWNHVLFTPAEILQLYNSYQ